MVSGRSAASATWYRLAVVEGLQPGEFVVVLLDQIGEPVEQLAALRGGHAAPRAFLECGAGRACTALSTSACVGLGDLADLFAGRRIEGRKCFTGLRSTQRLLIRSPVAVIGTVCCGAAVTVLVVSSSSNARGSGWGSVYRRRSHPLNSDYSYRNEVSGSTRVARRAGATQARSPTAERITTTPPSVTGSCGFTPTVQLR